MPPFQKTVTINSDASNVWSVLTDFNLMKKWMGDAEMNLEITTDWQVGSSIIINGFHHARFQNKGTILHYEANRILEYSHLSSLSRLEDKKENYSILRFEISPAEHEVELTLTIKIFPTETIYQHLVFYWRTAFEKIKTITEQQAELVN